MGIFHRKACENLLRNSKAMERIDRDQPEAIFDRKQMYSRRTGGDVQAETLFNLDSDDDKKAKRGKVGGQTLGLPVIIGIAVAIFLVAMVLLAVL